jgi:CcmD family protein
LISRVLTLLLVSVAVIVMVSGASIASAQGPGEITNGVVIGVDADSEGRLVRFAISDSGGNQLEYAVEGSTEYGLESQTGDRWVSNQSAEPVEAANRLRDHQRRFAAITVTSQNGIATSVVERESGKLETNLSFLFAVFAVTWAGFFAYIFFISRKQRELQKEVLRLRASIKRKADE